MKTQKVLCHKNNLDEVLSKVKDWKLSQTEKKKLIEFFEKYRAGEITNRIAENPERSLLRYLYFLKVALENLEDMTLEGVKKFRDDLLKDKIKHDNGAYSFRSKKDLMNNLKRYLDWRGKGNITKPLAIRIQITKADFNILDKDQIKKLIDETYDLDKKFLISVLATSGMRAEEFHNLRYSDFIFPKENESFLKIRLREEFSKTSGRTISLYDKECLKITKKYLNRKIEEGLKPEDAVFPQVYSSIRKWLYRQSKEILGFPINYHLFRHTRATQLSSEMNRQQLCIYFGWRFSSNMPDKYILRSGVEMKQIDEKFSKANIEELEEQLKSTNEEMAKIKSTIKMMAENSRQGKEVVFVGNTEEEDVILAPVRAKRKRV